MSLAAPWSSNPIWWEYSRDTKAPLLRRYEPLPDNLWTGQVAELESLLEKDSTGLPRISPD